MNLRVWRLHVFDCVMQVSASCCFLQLVHRISHRAIVMSLSFFSDCSLSSLIWARGLLYHLSVHFRNDDLTQPSDCATISDVRSNLLSDENVDQLSTKRIDTHTRRHDTDKERGKEGEHYVDVHSDNGTDEDKDKSWQTRLIEERHTQDGTPSNEIVGHVSWVSLPICGTSGDRYSRV